MLFVRNVEKKTNSQTNSERGVMRRIVMEGCKVNMCKFHTLWAKFNCDNPAHECPLTCRFYRKMNVSVEKIVADISEKHMKPWGGKIEIIEEILDDHIGRWS